ncbi:hypothetical protein HRR80_001025 [Exophiala dermatitidis]|uniref:Uncharacterized protein n=1 Tax=Exophiala dermatitidis TaxID=5970 RepID=A0AAN6F2J8_EXODE|nr:hypothetical protein HRR88_004782 [Exophiala dermatitidis]KAJ8994302.1 hypothetical protein HRR80_001025 [Exophiala dermatitidis]
MQMQMQMQMQMHFSCTRTINCQNYYQWWATSRKKVASPLCFLLVSFFPLFKTVRDQDFAMRANVICDPTFRNDTDQRKIQIEFTGTVHWLFGFGFRFGAIRLRL